MEGDFGSAAERKADPGRAETKNPGHAAGEGKAATEAEKRSEADTGPATNSESKGSATDKAKSQKGSTASPEYSNGIVEFGGE